jgi:hypothetical protein
VGMLRADGRADDDDDDDDSMDKDEDKESTLRADCSPPISACAAVNFRLVAATASSTSSSSLPPSSLSSSSSSLSRFLCPVTRRDDACGDCDGGKCEVNNTCSFECDRESGGGDADGCEEAAAADGQTMMGDKNRCRDRYFLMSPRNKDQESLILEPKKVCLCVCKKLKYC